MLNVIIWGAGGRVGQVVARMCLDDENINLVCGIDKFASPEDFNYKIYNSYVNCAEDADVIIDFSRPESLGDILTFSEQRKLPIVLATTGYDEEQLSKINKHAETNAVFRSYNMSLGINLLCSLVKKAAKILDGFDVEIIEKHHNRKVDAPSGTAIMLTDSVREEQKQKYNTYGRNGKSCKREPNEIGLHAVRGGTIVGQHDVIFAGYNEVVTLSHTAETKDVFASGAIAAAKYMKDKKQGLYSMADLVGC